MNVLDSPLEALALNYLSFGFFTFVSNLWTWIAVVTAAVGFWRILSAGDSSRLLTPPRDDLRSSNGPAPPSAAEAKPASSPAPTSASAPAPAPAPATATATEMVKSVEEIGATKGRKFVLLYDDVDGELTEEYPSEESDGELKAAEAEEEWWGRWERVLRTRTGKTEWYRYQDLTELNGNVVRFWDMDIDVDNCRSSRDTYCCGPKRCVLW